MASKGERTSVSQTIVPATMEMSPATRMMERAAKFIMEMPAYQRASLFFAGLAIMLTGAGATLGLLPVGIPIPEGAGLWTILSVKSIEAFVTLIGLCAAVPPLGIALVDKFGQFILSFTKRKKD